MKRFKGTSGEWKNDGYMYGKAYRCPNTYHIVSVETGNMVAGVIGKENANAVKAVPDMINALIDAKNAIDCNCGTEKCMGDCTHAIIALALKKALHNH